jgi:N-acetylglucosamine-6-phosphate deacetylase
MPEQKTYTAKKIFTGGEWLEDHSIITSGGIVTDIIPAVTPPQYHTILPAFIDLQVYGAYKKLYSVFPEPDTLSLVHRYSILGGAYWFMPTVATNTTGVVHRCIDGIRSYREKGGKGCLGLHVEGPWINKEKRGAHIESLVHAPSIDEVKQLLEYGKGVIKIITLAPEICSDEVIRTIIEYGVVVSAGHSNASYAEANAAFEKGVSAVTHLYNAMSGLMHREAGLVGASMLNEKVFASIIADGHHVDYAAVKIARQMMKERLFLITDAVTETNEGHYQHERLDDKYIAGGILSGSALTMMQAVKNMIHHAGVEKTEAIKMACSIPAKAIGMENQLGKITRGVAAHFISTDEGFSFAGLIE